MGSKILGKLISKLISFSRLFLPFIYKYIFELLYKKVLSRQYGYYGTYLDINNEKLFASWIIFVIMMISFTILRESKLKSFVRIMVYISIIPSMSIFGLKNENTMAFALITLYWFVWIFVIFVLDIGGKTRLTNGTSSFVPDSKKSYMWIILIWAIVSTLYFSYKYSSFRLFISFSDVYKYRNENVSMNTIEQYLFYWNTHIIIPLLIFVYYKNRKYIRSSMCLLLMILSYAIYGNKSMFFTDAFIIGLIILARFGWENLTDILIGIFLLIYQIICIILPKGLLVALAHRMLSIPAEGHYFYYDFFQSNPKLYLTQSILRHFFVSPYDKSISMIIGGNRKYYFSVTSSDINNMNNGLFSDAYQNFGNIGVIFYPIMIIITLYFLLKAIKDFDEGIQYIILMLSALFLFSAYYFSWLLTGGVIVLMVAIKYIKTHDNVK